MAHSIPAERLREGTIIKVDGVLTYSHVTSLIEGEALAERVKRDRARGSLYPVDVPHVTISLVDPQVIATGDNGTLTNEETFVEENVYVSAKGENAGHKCLNVDSRGTQLPTILELQDDGTYVQVTPAGELVKGLKVTLVMNVYKPRNYEKRGIGLQAVLVHEKVRTFGSGATAVADALAKAGITVAGSIAPQAAAPVAPGAEPAEMPSNELPMPGVFDTPVTELVNHTETQAAAAQAPVQAPIETPDEHIARLTAELAAAKAAAQPAAPVQPAVGSPWDVPAEA